MKLRDAAILAVIVLAVGADVKAATFTVPQNPLTTSTFIGNTPENGRFSDDWKFTVTQPSELAGSLTTIKVGGGTNLVFMEAFTAILDQTSLNLTFDYMKDRFTGATTLFLTLPNLSVGEHTVTVQGINHGASYGGNIAVVTNQPVATPIPASLLLFGSSLLGLTSLTSIKSKFWRKGNEA